MASIVRGAVVACLAAAWIGVGAVAASPAEPGRPGQGAAGDVGLPAVPTEMLGDALTAPTTIDAVPAVIDMDAPAHLALPPGRAARTAAPFAPSQVEPEPEWFRVDDGSPVLSINLRPGADHGLANRFDPADLVDEGRGAPRPVRLRRIHFWIGQNEPTGPMEWHVWEDNGGHKADRRRDIVPPFTVVGRPGENVIDLDELGLSIVIDPPRQFHVGVAGKTSEAGSPDVLMDDGLPFVGDSGDFHASVSGVALGVSPDSMYCGVREWVLMSARLPGEEQPRSPAWMIALEVEWLAAPVEEAFESVAASGFDGASRVAWGDYDGDGREDILANGSTLLRSNPNGTFTDVTSSAGITDTGSGALWADYDNDGDLDFYQYTGNCVPCGHADNFDDLWRNEGDGRFVNVRAVDYGGSADAPVPRDPLPTEAAAWGDFDGDGDLDLYAANHVDWASGDCYDDYLWLNEGPPRYGFRDVSVASGVRAATHCGRGVAPFDFDLDGDLDIFVANYRLNPDLLWVNQGVTDGVPRFVDQATAKGVRGVAKLGQFAGAYGHTIGAAWGDLDQDGDPDLVAANLAHSAWLCFSDQTMIYDNQGPTAGYRFKDVRGEAGVAYVETHSDPSLADFDNDGWLDLHITHVYDGWRASLYRNATGDRADIRPTTVYLPRAVVRDVPTEPTSAPPEPTSVPPEPTSGPPEPTSGPPEPTSALPEPTSGTPEPTAVPPEPTAPVLGRGVAPPGGALAAPEQAAKRPIRFAQVTHLGGIHPRTGWGSGWSDYDGDGDLDLAASGLWRNQARPGDDARYVQVEVRGCGLSNRDGIGTRVRVVSGPRHGFVPLDQWQAVVSARGTGSQDTRVLHFGLGARTGVDRIEVRFPSGQTSVIEGDVPIDRRVEVVEVGAWVRPSTWTPRVGDDVAVVADTCGRARELSWDLDADGEFDDGSGPSVTWRPAAPGRQALSVAAREGQIRAVTSAEVEVAP